MCNKHSRTCENTDKLHSELPVPLHLCHTVNTEISYINAIETIFQPDYMPSNMDIVRAPESIETMKETELKMSSSVLRVVELRESQAVKIMSQFADVQFCLFTLDLTCYDRYLDDAQRTNELQGRLADLKGICRSGYFCKSIILLIFTNAEALKERIAISPLKSHFEDYGGGNNYDAATKYILKRCKQVNRLDLPMFWHIHSLEDSEGDAMDQFFRQSQASISAVSWLREIGIGTS